MTCEHVSNTSKPERVREFDSPTIRRRSDDGMIYPIEWPCGCVHFYYRGPDNYVHTVLCRAHRPEVV